MQGHPANKGKNNFEESIPILSLPQDSFATTGLAIKLIFPFIPRSVQTQMTGAPIHGQCIANVHAC